MSHPKWSKDYTAVIVEDHNRTTVFHGTGAGVNIDHNEYGRDADLYLSDDHVCGLLMAWLHRENLTRDEILRAFDLLDDDHAG